MFEIRKCHRGYSIDKFMNGHWMFYIKLPTKKQCLMFIKTKTEIKCNQINIEFK